jgi:cysteine desulfurase
MAPAADGRPKAVTRVYLDYNASAPLLPEALAAAQPYYTQLWGNASSIHRLGREARLAVEEAREQVAQLLGASDPLDIVFTGSGTEAVNLALRGYVGANRTRGRHLVTTAIEHPAVLDTCRALQRQGFEVTLAPVDGQGRVDPDALAGCLRPDTLLVSVIHGHHEIGTLQPLAELIEVAHARDVPVHVDAAQAVGRVELDVQALGVDLLSFSGHKFGGPKGSGALYIRPGLGRRMQALIHGGHQERERRAGTEDVPTIVALGRACALMRTRLTDEAKRLAALRDRLERELVARVPAAHVLGGGGARLPNTSTISFPGVKGEALVFNLDLLGIAASTGASCTSRQDGPSPALEALGVSRQDSEGAVRFSLGWATTEADIERVIEVVPPIVERLRRLSPFS